MKQELLTAIFLATIGCSGAAKQTSLESKPSVEDDFDNESSFEIEFAIDGLNAETPPEKTSSLYRTLRNVTGVSQVSIDAESSLITVRALESTSVQTLQLAIEKLGFVIIKNGEDILPTQDLPDEGTDESDDLPPPVDEVDEEDEEDEGTGEIETVEGDDP